ncbi:MazG-like family protein [Flavobacterium sp.]|uniref:MazG-like family protein n=1 Tax=Flavobacterium sp. TaxID=239 RepID=UPI003750ECAD
MYKLEELQPLIIEWAREKDLIKLENAPKQRLKLIEECGELASAILKNNVELQKDAVGDIFVVLIILSRQVKSEINLDFENFKVETNDITNLLLDITYTYDRPDTEIVWLNELSNLLKLDLTECVNLAWNEIKDRKGNTINGTFLKN